MMSVEYAGMTSGTNGETPVDTPVKTPMSIPVSLGAVGYAAFALLQAIPLSEIVPFSEVVAAFEAEGAHQVPAPVLAAVPEPEREPEPEPEPKPVFTPTAQPVPEPAIAYTEGGYRPAPGPQLCGRKEPVLERGADRAGDVTTPAAASMRQDGAAPVGLEQPSDGVAVAAGAPPPLGEGYAANRASGDSKARQVLDELSFLFDEN